MYLLTAKLYNLHVSYSVLYCIIYIWCSEAPHRALCTSVLSLYHCTIITWNYLSTSCGGGGYQRLEDKYTCKQEWYLDLYTQHILTEKEHVRQSHKANADRSLLTSAGLPTSNTWDSLINTHNQMNLYVDILLQATKKILSLTGKSWELAGLLVCSI